MTQSMIKGLQCIIGRFQRRSAIWKFSEVRRINIAKQKDGLISFLMLNVLEAKIFQYDFLAGHNVCQNNCY